METLSTLQEIEQAAENGKMVLFYLSRSECGVCTALLPKIRKRLLEFPELSSFYVDLNHDPMVQGQLSIFTIPAVLVFAEGREAIREARYISVDDLFSKIDRLYHLVFG